MTACRACHDNHHTAGVECATCHRTEGIIQAHAPPVDAHRACSECHTAAPVAALEPTRSFCLACDSSRADHYQADADELARLWRAHEPEIRTAAGRHEPWCARWLQEHRV